jgi:anti-anti-sigma regulatory factor
VALETTLGPIALDLRDVSFMDSCGARLLWDAAGRNADEQRLSGDG